MWPQKSVSEYYLDNVIGVVSCPSYFLRWLADSTDIVFRTSRGMELVEVSSQEHRCDLL